MDITFDPNSIAQLVNRKLAKSMLIATLQRCLGETTTVEREGQFLAVSGAGVPATILFISQYLKLIQETVGGERLEFREGGLEKIDPAVAVIDGAFGVAHCYDPMFPYLYVYTVDEHSQGFMTLLRSLESHEDQITDLDPEMIMSEVDKLVAGEDL